MAVNEVKENRKIKLELDGGMNGDKQIIKSKTYAKVKVDSTNEDMLAVGTALADLQEKPLLKVKKLEEAYLYEE
mgnify:CR=1 FL=1